MVEWHHDDGSVWYDILAFSRPNHALAKLGKPFSRALQKRFARDSKRAMAKAAAAQWPGRGREISWSPEGGERPLAQGASPGNRRWRPPQHSGIGSGPRLANQLPSCLSFRLSRILCLTSGQGEPTHFPGLTPSATVSRRPTS